jgi:hypothetical protein
MSQF